MDLYSQIAKAAVVMQSAHHRGANGSEMEAAIEAFERAAALAQADPKERDRLRPMFEAVAHVQFYGALQQPWDKLRPTLVALTAPPAPAAARGGAR